MGDEIELSRYLDVASRVVFYSKEYYHEGERNLDKENKLLKDWEEIELEIIKRGYKSLSLTELATYLEIHRAYLDNPKLEKMEKDEIGISHARICRKFVFKRINPSRKYSDVEREKLFGAFGLPKTETYASRLKSRLEAKLKKKQ